MMYGVDMKFDTTAFLGCSGVRKLPPVIENSS